MQRFFQWLLPFNWLYQPDKNPTPHEVALITAANLSFASFGLLLLVELIFPALPWWVVVAFPAVLFLLAYQVFSYSLSRFIYRKIKVIYKSIHHLKQPKGSIAQKVNLRTDILSEVEQEVADWAAARNREIDYLRNMEQYRRDFIGNVSHELKTPIFNLQGLLYTLLDSGLEDEEINISYLQRAVQNIERLSSIVEDLNIIAQLEANELHLEMEQFNIIELVREVFADLELKAEEKNITLKFKEGANRPFLVYADRERIRQVMNNLIANAINYGRQNGKVAIGVYDMDSNVLIEVADNGVGVAPEHLPRLFERFYRVDKGRSREHGGTGLGLAIVKHLIEAHQQTINVRSAVGLGSTFGFTLQKAPSSEANSFATRNRLPIF